MRYRCLFVDHDDTAVDSTATVHYPAHLEVMGRLRPAVRPVSLEDWLLKNFDPGLMVYLRGELAMTESEIAEEARIWRNHLQRSRPRFFTGFVEILAQFRRRGGKIVVTTHSEADTVWRHYKTAGFSPDLVFGWTDVEERRKPHPWPVWEGLRRLGLGRNQALVLDDLKPGILMARSAGVASAGAGWCHRIPRIVSYMREHCDAYFETVDAFGRYLLGTGPAEEERT